MFENTLGAIAILLALSGVVGLGTARAEHPSLAPVRDISSPEDLLQLPTSPWVVVSSMRSEGAGGRLALVDSRRPERTATLDLSAQPWAAELAPHGIAARSLGQARVELLVVDHGGGEQVDRIELALHGDAQPTVTRASRIALPPGVAANGVAALSDGFVLTSMFDPRDPEFVEKFARREPTGTVWRWSEARGFTKLASLPLSGANGIAVSHDNRTVFATEWAANKLWRIPLDGTKPSAVPTSFHPDNLRWTARGDLLVVGQLGDARELFACKPGGGCRVGYVVARIDPATLAIRHVLTADGLDGFSGATGAIEVENTLWLGTYTGDAVARVATPKR